MFIMSEKENIVNESFISDTDVINNSVEEVRKSSKRSIHADLSWEQNCYASFQHSKEFDNPSPVFKTMMLADLCQEDVNDKNRIHCSTQTDSYAHMADVSISFGKNINLLDVNNSEHSFKRYRQDFIEGEHDELQPHKKKCIESYSSRSYLIKNEMKICNEPSQTNNLLSSSSETSFKSISSNHSFKIRKRRLKSESNLFKDAIQRSRKTGFNKSNVTESVPCVAGGTPRKERNRRNNRAKAWKILDLCSWIGKKSYQSLTGLYSEMLREPIFKNDTADNFHIEELLVLKRHMEEVDKKQVELEKDNAFLKESLKKLMCRVEELETKMSNHNQTVLKTVLPPSPPPLPPPPPPPPPPMPPASKLPVRSHTLPRCGSAPPRIVGPRLTITPQDIANVKLRKTKDNPVRKPPPKDSPQPLVTQQMLQSTRAKLGRTRPVAASTPKQQLSELEKCLLQETSVTSLYRRRVARTTTFRSAEELRSRPYPTARCQRSPRSDRSPRSNSLPRGKSPLKMQKCLIPK